MEKEEMILLGIVGVVGFALLVKLMISLIKKHGVSVSRGRKKSRAEELGYKPSKTAKVAAACALGSFLCGVLAATKPFRDDL